MKIRSLRIVNYMGALDVEIIVHDHTIEIVGKNGVGKSSVFDAIKGAIMGAVGMDKMPLTTGERRGHVRLDLAELVIERKLTFTNPRPGTMRIEAADGKRWGQPELNAIFTKLMFDPLALSRQNDAEFIGTLRQLAGQPFCAKLAKLDTALEDAKDDRKEAKLCLKHHGEPERPTWRKIDPVDTSALTYELQEIHKFNREQQVAASQKEAAAYEIDNCASIIERVERAIEVQKEMLREARVEHAQAMAAQAGLPKPEAVKSTEEIEEQLSDASATNDRAHSWERYDESVRVQRGLQSDVDKLEDKVAVRKDKRAAHARTAKLPIAGLAWTEDGVFLGDVPWSQINSAAKLDACCDMVMAMGGPLEVMFVRLGGLLDQETFECIDAKAEEAGWQFWCETVGKGHGRNVVEIVEGEPQERWEPTGQVVELVGGEAVSE